MNTKTLIPNASVLSVQQSKNYNHYLIRIYTGKCTFGLHSLVPYFRRIDALRILSISAARAMLYKHLSPTRVKPTGTKVRGNRWPSVRLQSQHYPDLNSCSHLNTFVKAQRKHFPNPPLIC